MKKVWKTILSVLLMFTIIFGQLFPWITAYAEGSDTTNLISNGDFSSSSGTVTVPNVILEADCEDFAEDALWVTYDGSGTTSVVTDPNDETNRVAAFTSTDNSNTGIAYKPDKGFFEQGKTYTVSFDYKGTAQFHVFTLGLMNAGYTIVEVNGDKADWLPIKADEWTNYSFEIIPTMEITSDTTQRLMFQMATSGGGTFYIDNLTVTHGTKEVTGSGSWNYVDANGDIGNVKEQIVSSVMVPNYIVQDDFESGALNTNVWKNNAWGNQNSGATLVQSVVREADNYVQKIEYANSNGGAYYSATAGTFESEKEYVVSFRYKSTVTLQIKTHNINTSNTWKENIARLTATDEWTTFTTTLTAASGLTNVWQGIYIATDGDTSDGSNNIYYIDDFSIACGETEKLHSVTTELVTNGDFEDISYNYAEWITSNHNGTYETSETSVVYDDVETGNRALKFTSNGTNNGVYLSLPKSLFEDGKEYTLSFRMRGNRAFHIYAYNVLQANDKLVDDWISVNSSWSAYEINLTQVADISGERRIYFKLAANTDNPEGEYTFYLDDVSLSYTESTIVKEYTDGIGTCNDTEEDNVLYIKDYKSVSQKLTIEAGMAYQYSFMAKSANEGTDFSFTVVAGENELPAVSLSEEWTEVTGSFLANYAAEEFAFAKSGAGEVFIDDVSLWEAGNSGIPITATLKEMHTEQEGTLVLEGTFPENQGSADDCQQTWNINGEDKVVTVLWEGNTLKADVSSHLDGTKQNTILIPEGTTWLDEKASPLFYLREAITVYTQKVDAQWLAWTSVGNTQDIIYVNQGQGENHILENKAGDTLVVAGKTDFTLGNKEGKISLTDAGDYTVCQTISNILYKYTVAIYKRGDVSNVSTGFSCGDLVAIKKAAKSEQEVFGYSRMKAADVNMDNVVNDKDAAYVRKVLVTTGEIYEPIVTADLKYGEEVNLLSGEIYEFASAYEKKKSADYNADKVDVYAPEKVALTWKCSKEAEYYTVKVSLREDLESAVSYVTLDETLTLTDLYAGEDYYYQILANCSDCTVKSEIYRFRTANLPRTIEVQGVTNTRDIGGYYTTSGEYRVKQGMVYRGGALDDIGTEGIQKMLYTYNIKTDLDVRSAGGTVSPLGDSVQLKGYKWPQYTVFEDNILNEDFHLAMRETISLFANEANYPIYLHCQIGRDRTGTLSFLLNALMGVGEMDLFRDYELSFFSEGGHRDHSSVERLVDYHFTEMYNYFVNYNTSCTVAENVEHFMIHVLGVTGDEIASIKNILLEEVVENEEQEENTTVAVANLYDLDRVVSTYGINIEDKEFACAYSAEAAIVNGAYGCTSVETWTEEEASSNGVPEGYAGTVLSVVKDDTSKGIRINFKEQKLPTTLVDSITFRVCIGDDGNSTNNYPQLRVNAGSGWLVQYSVNDKIGQWVDVALKSDGTGFSSSTYSFADLSTDGYLGEFELCSRNNANTYFYIDSIKVTLKEDTEAPVLTYVGDDELYFPEGSEFNISASAYDALEERSIDVEYLWDEEPFESDGVSLKAGTYTLTLCATDYTGNVVSKEITVHVTGMDDDAPIVDTTANTIYVLTGTIPELSVGVTDNTQVLTKESVWSEGALDVRQRLTAGTHTWTITATDVAGNKTEKIITFIVASEEVLKDVIIDEDRLMEGTGL